MIKSVFWKRALLAGSISGIASAVSFPAFAQEAQTAPKTDAEGNEIVVTGLRRNARL